MILFLDIDGVLHPADCPDGERYRAVPRLAALLREVVFRRVEIVFTAPAFGSFSVSPLRDVFPADLRHRILGATDGNGEAGAGTREQEIRSWLANGGSRHGQGCRPWLAIDAATDLYAPDSTHLFAVDGRTGLNGPDMTQLRCRMVSDCGLLH